jgi:chromosome segregation ATPase
VIEYIELQCPNCQRGLRVRTTYVGKHVRCKQCQHTFPVQAPASRPATAERPVPAPATGGLEEVFQRLRVELDAHRTDHADTMRRLTQAQEEGDRLRAQVHELRGQVDDAGRRLEEVESLRQQLFLAETESSRLRTQIASLEAVGHELQAARDERDALRGQIQQLQSHLDASGAEVEQLRQAAAELETVRGERDRLNDEQKAGTQTAEELRGRVADLEHTLAEAMAAHEASHADLVRSHEQARDQWAADLKGHLGEAEERLRKHQTEAETVGRQRDQESAALRDELATLKQEHPAALGQIESLRGEVAQLREELEGARKAKEEDSRRHEHEGKQFEAECQSLKGEIHTLGLQAADLRQERDALRADLDQHRERAVALQKELGETRGGGNAECERLKQALAEEQARVAAEKTQRETAQRRFEAMSAEVDSLQQELKVLQQMLQAMGISP